MKVHVYALLLRGGIHRSEDLRECQDDKIDAAYERCRDERSSG